MISKAKRSDTIPGKRNRQTPVHKVGEDQTSRQQPAETKPSVSTPASDKNENPSAVESNKIGKQPITNQDEQEQITNKESEKPGSF